MSLTSPHDVYAETTKKRRLAPNGHVLVSATSSAHEGPLTIGFLGSFRFNAKRRTTLFLQVMRNGVAIAGAHARLSMDPDDVGETAAKIDWLITDGGPPALYEVAKTAGIGIDVLGGKLALKPLVA